MVAEDEGGACFACFGTDTDCVLLLLEVRSDNFGFLVDRRLEAIGDLDRELERELALERLELLLELEYELELDDEVDDEEEYDDPEE